jgi:hypothetical protein
MLLSRWADKPRPLQDAIPTCSDVCEVEWMDAEVSGPAPSAANRHGPRFGCFVSTRFWYSSVLISGWVLCGYIDRLALTFAGSFVSAVHVRVHGEAQGHPAHHRRVLGRSFPRRPPLARSRWCVRVHARARVCARVRACECVRIYIFCVQTPHTARGCTRTHRHTHRHARKSARIRKHTPAWFWRLWQPKASSACGC